jgi:hypothetical protein
LATFAALIGLSAQAADLPPRRAYEVVTETAMPHLEESLRYATTRQKRCLSQAELHSVFPVLRHESLKGCNLGDESRNDETVSYRLICGGGNLTTGAARWRLGAAHVSGTLDVKLGGKNMTFNQRVTATPLGECSPEAN